ncbi:MAG: MATE family efflux transporter [Phycisphaerales bacterium]|nr:MATE family efflux transporter [Phycisphaerales bacterium]
MSDPIHITRRPSVELLMLAGPSIAQMISYTLMQFIDRLMLAKIGTAQAAVTGTAGLTFFCFISFGSGVLSLINALASQAYGRKDLRQTGQFLWQGIWWGLAFGLVILSLYPLAEPLFARMKHTPRMVALETQYFQIVLLAGTVKLTAMAMGQFLLAIHRPTLVFIAAFTGVCANCLLNWLLIFGHGGFPRMELAGSAWGLNTGVFTEMLILLAFIASPKIRHTYNTFDWRFRWDKMKTLLRVGTPAGLQFSCDIIAWTVFANIIIAKFGDAAIMANSFAFGYMAVSFMPAIGLGVAVTALTGKYIGMNRHDLVRRRAHLGFVFAASYMFLCGVGFFLFRHKLMGIFSDNLEVQSVGATMLIFVAIYQIFDAMFVIYSSALRGAGDTLIPTIVQLTLIWSIVVGGGILAARHAPSYGISGPWTLATLFGAILGIYLLIRFQRGKWQTIRLHHDNETVENSKFETRNSNQIPNSKFE